jgi:hypothetical protein
MPETGDVRPLDHASLERRRATDRARDAERNLADLHLDDATHRSGRFGGWTVRERDDGTLRQTAYRVPEWRRDNVRRRPDGVERARSQETDWLERIDNRDRHAAELAEREESLTVDAIVHRAGESAARRHSGAKRRRRLARARAKYHRAR